MHNHPGGSKPVPEAVRSAIIGACRDAFHWRDDVKSLFITCGVPPALYDRYDEQGMSKPKIARGVLNDIQAMGAKGDAIQIRIVDELCLMDKPHPDAPDQKKGREALAHLKYLAASHKLLADPDRDATALRRQREEQKRRVQQLRLERLGMLKDKFNELLKPQITTHAQRQKRGYDLEALLADLFQAHDIDYRRPYRAEHEQIDGSFYFRGFTYIVEAKWQQEPPGFGDMAAFKAKVDGKLDSTRGMFVSMAGYDDNTLDHLFKVARNSRNNLVLMDAFDLITIFEGRLALTDALEAKITAAEQEGRYWVPLGR